MGHTCIIEFYPTRRCLAFGGDFAYEDIIFIQVNLLPSARLQYSYMLIFVCDNVQLSDCLLDPVISCIYLH